MTSHPEQQSKLGATPGKIAVAAVLAVIFIAVLVYQFAGTGASAQAKTKDAKRRPERPTATRHRVAKQETMKPQKLAVKRTPRNWPTFSLDQVVRHDPFGLPIALRTLPEPEVAIKEVAASNDSQPANNELMNRYANELAALHRDGVRFVYISDEEKFAIVGSRTVRVGDVVAGHLVEDIQADGITLASDSDTE